MYALGTFSSVEVTSFGLQEDHSHSNCYETVDM